MPLLEPFASPACFGIAASSIGVALQGKFYPGEDDWVRSALFGAGILGSTLFGRLFFDLAPPAFATLFTLVTGLLLPVLIARRLELSTSNSEYAGERASAFLKGLMLVSSAVVAVIGLGLRPEFLPVPRGVFVLLAFPPVVVGVFGLRKRA